MLYLFKPLGYNRFYWPIHKGAIQMSKLLNDGITIYEALQLYKRWKICNTCISEAIRLEHVAN